MAWVSIALRKQSLQADKNELTYQLLQLSREKRAIHRHQAYEESVFNADKSQELAAIKKEWNEAKEGRPDPSSADYEQWKTSYSIAQEVYQSQRQDILDYYDQIQTDIEDEVQMQEDAIDDQKTQIETQRQAVDTELQSLQDQVKTEIQNEAIKF